MQTCQLTLKTFFITKFAAKNSFFPDKNSVTVPFLNHVAKCSDKVIIGNFNGSNNVIKRLSNHGQTIV